jgi:hypothetical protein
VARAIAKGVGGHGATRAARGIAPAAKTGVSKGAATAKKAAMPRAAHAPFGPQTSWHDRAVLPQYHPMSCGLAAARMLITTLTGKDVAEDKLAKESEFYEGSYDPLNGTNVVNLKPLLFSHGVEASVDYGRTVQDLRSATSHGFPALVLLTEPRHFVVVDQVIDVEGELYLAVRNPLPLGTGTKHMLSASEFTPRFTGTMISTAPS